MKYPLPPETIRERVMQQLHHNAKVRVDVPGKGYIWFYPLPGVPKSMARSSKTAWRYKGERVKIDYLIRVRKALDDYAQAVIGPSAYKWVVFPA